MILVRSQVKPFNITVTQVYAPTNKVEEAKVDQFYEDLEDLLEVPPKKKKKIHHWGLECKSRKSRDTWSKQASLALQNKMKQDKG